MAAFVKPGSWRSVAVSWGAVARSPRAAGISGTAAPCSEVSVRRAEARAAGARRAVSPRSRRRLASVANAARHSGAEVLRLYLERLEAGMRLKVVDDGAGFDDQQPRRGYGLVTMKDRADALGGKLRIDSRRGAGTEVELEL